jgi:hypothetical protein
LFNEETSAILSIVSKASLSQAQRQTRAAAAANPAVAQQPRYDVRSSRLRLGEDIDAATTTAATIFNFQYRQYVQQI